MLAMFDHVGGSKNIFHNWFAFIHAYEPNTSFFLYILRSFSLFCVFRAWVNGVINKVYHS